MFYYLDCSVSVMGLDICPNPSIVYIKHVQGSFCIPIIPEQSYFLHFKNPTEKIKMIIIIILYFRNRIHSFDKSLRANMIKGIDLNM